MTDPMSEFEPCLQLYLRRNWLVLPCDWRPGSRKPLFTGGFRLASRDPAVVRSWWQREPRALVAIATGKRTQGSGMAIVDVDPEHDGFATLAQLIGPELPRAPAGPHALGRPASLFPVPARRVVLDGR
jgi:hypothetical protein